MATPLPVFLQTLAELGIVQVVPKTPAASAVATPIDSTGSLGAGFPLSGSDSRLSAPKKQPPLFWKAVGFFLKNRFSSAGSLLDSDRALFFADPGQVGIPDGGACPEEVTNYQAFLFADTMQRVNQPSFSLSGSSYFEFLNLYLRNAGEENETTDLAQARKILLDAKLKKDLAWEAARATFIAKGSTSSGPKKGDTDPSLIDYIENDSNYKSAWDVEKAAQNNLEALSKPEMASALLQLNLLRLADMRLEFQKGNNMPVVAIDSDWVGQLLQNPTSDSTLESLPNLLKSVYYRPLYSLPDYSGIVNNWYKNVPSASNMIRDGPHPLPLAGIWDRSWADLGHPLLDDAQLPGGGELSPEKKDFINSLSATLTFIQKPYEGNVNRGMWDVPDARGRFELQPHAPQRVREAVYKTSKFIIAWGIEIELTIPEVLSQSEASVKNITLAGMDLPLKEVVGGNKLVFSGGGDYPILVGAFAERV